MQPEAAVDAGRHSGWWRRRGGYGMGHPHPVRASVQVLGPVHL